MTHIEHGAFEARHGVFLWKYAKKLHEVARFLTRRTRPAGRATPHILKSKTERKLGQKDIIHANQNDSCP